MKTVATGTEQEFFGYWRERMRGVAEQALEHRLSGKFATSDLLQDMVTYAWQHLAAFRGKTDVEMEAWLRKIIGGLSQNLSRHYRTRKRDIAKEKPIMAGFTRASTDQSAEAAVEIAELATAVDCLDERYRKIVLMYIFEHRTFAEIGAVLGRSETAIRQTYSNGLDEIKAILDGRPTETAE